jgi:hypothetical protein
MPILLMLLYTYPSAYTYLFALIFAYVCLCLLPTYAHLFILMVSYVCLCMLIYVICLLMGYNISEGIFYWDYEVGKKGKYLEGDLCI